MSARCAAASTPIAATSTNTVCRRPSTISRSHAVVGFDTHPPAVAGIAALAARYNRDLFAFRSDSDLAQIATVRAGLGIGGIQHGIARRDKNLMPVLPRAVTWSLDMWLAMHEDQRVNRRLRLVFDRFAKGLKSQVKAPAPR